jgi:hypothetical protein
MKPLTFAARSEKEQKSSSKGNAGERGKRRKKSKKFLRNTAKKFVSNKKAFTFAAPTKSRAAGKPEDL